MSANIFWGIRGKKKVFSITHRRCRIDSDADHFILGKLVYRRGLAEPLLR